MTSKRIAHDRQQKSDKPQESGILQRAAVRPVWDAGMQSTDDREGLALSNSAFSKDFSQVPISTTKPQPIMAKLTIGAVGDKYEQEADRVAAQVVQRINAPAPVQSGEDETVKPEEMETKDNEARLMRSPILQRKSSDDGMAATPDLEASINQARGGGQPMANNIREPMEQAFGADLSGVKIHANAQSDELNRSIQARAFTTGKDVFFRQGAYEPGSLGGQELLAHELTHVVQQNGGTVQRKQIIQRYSDIENQGKVSTTKKLRLDKSTVPEKLYATKEKLEEANNIRNGNVIFLSDGKDPMKDTRFLVKPSIKDNSELDKALKQNGQAEDEPKGNYEETIQRLASKIEDEFMDEFDDDQAKINAKLEVNTKKDREKKLVDIATEQLLQKGISVNTIKERLAAYLKKDETLASRPLMPSDCREMANYIAGGDPEKNLVQDGILTAGKVLKYTPGDVSKAEWPFHFATIIMTDDTDHVTMENAAAKETEIFSKKKYDHSWYFEMYGSKDGQTFKDKYKKDMNE
ncbi:eCIS core domain-containing protein [Nostoc sp.]|uniref:eCIS core domain-containing protein n=1 Tax=Nostoc sp. TaxID=1180 RepID=UPI002FF5A603